ncbi:hypothetical protein BDR22DRAFT_818552 [Usnea florida]
MIGPSLSPIRRSRVRLQIRLCCVSCFVGKKYPLCFQLVAGLQRPKIAFETLLETFVVFLVPSVRNTVVSNLWSVATRDVFGDRKGNRNLAVFGREAVVCCKAGFHEAIFAVFVVAGNPDTLLVSVILILLLVVLLVPLARNNLVAILLEVLIRVLLEPNGVSFGQCWETWQSFWRIFSRMPLSSEICKVLVKMCFVEGEDAFDSDAEGDAECYYNKSFRQQVDNTGYEQTCQCGESVWASLGFFLGWLVRAISWMIRLHEQPPNITNILLPALVHPWKIDMTVPQNFKPQASSLMYKSPPGSVKSAVCLPSVKLHVQVPPGLDEIAVCLPSIKLDVEATSRIFQERRLLPKRRVSFMDK